MLSVVDIIKKKVNNKKEGLENFTVETEQVQLHSKQESRVITKNKLL